MRDFFYNKGDVFLAILIILVAAFVIYVRVGVIMDYSATGDNSSSLFPVPPSLIGGPENGGQGAGSNQGGSSGETDPAGTPPDGQELPGTPEPGATSVQITVNAGDAASTIADKLYAAGVITDREAFLSDVMSQGADAGLKTGTFTIPIGANNAEIIAILAG